MATATLPPLPTQVTSPRAAMSAGIPARLESVDLVRGSVMVLMVLDHVREYITNARINAADLARDDPGLVSDPVGHPLLCPRHSCSWRGRGCSWRRPAVRPRPELSRFLLTRGFWLIFLEVTVVRLGMTFNLDYRFIPAGVLWAIGWSMVRSGGLDLAPQAARPRLRCRADRRP